MAVDPRITKAKRLISAANTRCGELDATHMNRATRTRQQYKTKADALDAVSEVLSARPKAK
jgi:hypothetical protein